LILQGYCRPIGTGIKLSTLEKETICGILGESMKILTTSIKKYLEPVSKFLQKCTDDSEPQVRNNAVWALGEMLQHGRAEVGM
jgi:hypothetical protein